MIIPIIQTLIVLSFIVVPIVLIYIYESKYLKMESYLMENGYYTDNGENSINETDTFSRKRPIIGIVLYLIIFFILSEILALVVQIIYISYNEIPLEMLDPDNPLFNKAVYNEMLQDLNILLQALIYSAALIVSLFIGIKWIIQDLLKFKGRFVGYAFMGFGLLYAGNYIGQIILTIIGVNGTATNQEAIESLMSSTPNIVIMGIITILFAPIIEEIVFRKCFFSLFRKRKKLALVISSLSFGALHVVSSALLVLIELLGGKGSYNDFIYELAYIIPYSLMGLGIGIAYLKSNENIVTTIITHALNNAFSFIIMLLLPLLEQFMY